MKRMLGILLVLGAFAGPARALSLHPALELEGGSSRLERSGDREAASVEHGRPQMGFGVTVGGDPMARVSIRAGLLYRYGGSRLTSSDAYLSSLGFRSTDRWSTLRIPVRAAWAPGRQAHWLLEGGLAGRYMLKATQEAEFDAMPFARRPANSNASIFESLYGERDVTEFVRRGDVTASAGIGWRGKYGGRATTFTLRYEHGFYDFALGDPGSNARERALSAGVSIGW